VGLEPLAIGVTDEDEQVDGLTPSAPMNLRLPHGPRDPARSFRI
jgi:hypothetical protein